ncbi:MAG: hypothetical protein ACXW30_05800 [Micavibrio sp.]
MADSEYLMDIIPDTAWAEGTIAPAGISYDRVSHARKLTPGEGAVQIARLDDPQNFSRYRYRVNRLQDEFKKPGKLVHTIPTEYAQFAEALQKIAAYEARHSPLFLWKRGYLTIRQNEMRPGQNQVSLGWHTDRSDRIGRAQYPLLDHIYVVSDLCPTLVQDRPLRDAFNQLNADKVTGAKSGLSRQADPYAILLMNNYCYHASPIVDRSGTRTFLRVMYESPSVTDLATLPRAEKQRLQLDYL